MLPPFEPRFVSPRREIKFCSLCFVSYLSLRLHKREICDVALGQSHSDHRQPVPLTCIKFTFTAFSHHDGWDIRNVITRMLSNRFSLICARNRIVLTLSIKTTTRIVFKKNLYYSKTYFEQVFSVFLCRVYVTCYT